MAHETRKFRQRLSVVQQTQAGLPKGSVQSPHDPTNSSTEKL